MTPWQRAGVLALAVRPQFFAAILAPILTAAALAFRQQGGLDPWRLLLLLAGGVAIHGGANALNDYYDHISGVDPAHRQPLTPLAGGSRLIQRGRLSPRSVLVLGACLVAAAVAFGAVLAALLGSVLLLVLLLSGCALGVAYSCPPFSLACRGLGEPAVFLAFGLLPTCCGHYVLAGRWDPAAAVLALPLAFAITAVLCVNQFPDHDADASGGKRTLVVRLGRERARWMPLILHVGAVTSAAAAVLIGSLSAAALVGLVPAAALAALALVALWRADGRPASYLPAMRWTLAVHALFAVCLPAFLVLAH